MPLSQRSGIIEWVENTMPLGEYLLDAHKNYNVGDMSPSTARGNFKVCNQIVIRVQSDSFDNLIE